MPNEQEQSYIDRRKLNQMKIEILEQERKNVNTRSLTNTEMVEAIRRTIIKIADKSF